MSVLPTSMPSNNSFETLDQEQDIELTEGSPIGKEPNQLTKTNVGKNKKKKQAERGGKPD